MVISDTAEIAMRFVELYEACNGWLTAKGWPTMTIDEFTTFMESNFRIRLPEATPTEEPR